MEIAPIFQFNACTTDHFVNMDAFTRGLNVYSFVYKLEVVQEQLALPAC